MRRMRRSFSCVAVCLAVAAGSAEQNINRKESMIDRRECMEKRANLTVLQTLSAICMERTSLKDDVPDNDLRSSLGAIKEHYTAASGGKKW
jgi:hypothetical protein